MTVPQWWEQQRLGVVVHIGVAAVPGWAPIGRHADRYALHLSGGTPNVEVLEHHRERWGHVEHYDDFAPLLTLQRFDPTEWVRLARDAGAGYAAVVARGADGWAGWDAPDDPRTLVAHGPRRNIVRDFLTACDREGLVGGVYYDAGGLTVADPDAVSGDLDDLRRRLGARFARVEGMPTSLEAGVDGPDAVLLDDDAWITGFEWAPPDETPHAPWELRRSIGRGDGYNRAERAEHQMTAHEIVALLTEVIAKGGHLLLGVGADGDGVIPHAQVEPLRAVGRWIARHHALVERGRPWAVWGDDASRFIDVDGTLHAIDVDGRGEFAVLTPERFPVRTVWRDGVALHFTQDGDGLHLDDARTRGLARRSKPNLDVVGVYSIEPAAERAEQHALFVHADRPPIRLTDLLRGVHERDVVQLGDGRYEGPLTVPDGVTVRGLGSNRTVIDPGDGELTLGAGSRLEYVTVRRGTDGGEALPPRTIAAGDGVAIVGCHVEGAIAVRADDVEVRATNAVSIDSAGCNRVSVARCHLHGTATDTAVLLLGGEGHTIESTEIVGHGCGVHAAGTSHVTIRHNHVRSRWQGVSIERCESTHVHGNFVERSVRGVTVEGGSDTIVDGNAVSDGDSGCIVAWGAAACEVSGNTWERCRIGVLMWEAPAVHVHGNDAIDLYGA